ncbi:MAG: hypothetical protein P4M04_12915 [Acidobacteriota bacterium]|nr:hypothetical protein [Acidobacteriota bacterium]
MVQLAGPTRKDVKAFGVEEPAGGSLVQASAPCDAVAGLVFDDAGFLMKNPICSHGLAVLVARDCDLYFQDSLSHHPRQKLQGTRFAMVARLQGEGSDALLNCVVQLLALLNRVNFFLVECAANHEAHVPIVANHSFDAAGRECKRRGPEVPR